MPMNALITGSNRGLGLAWAHRLVAEGWRVFASCRHPAEAAALHELARQSPRLTVHRADISSPDDIRGLYWELESEPIDLLVNNAGVYLEKGATPIGSLRYDDWLRTFEVNTLGAVRMVEAFAENVARSRKRLIISVTSHMGSIADISTSGSYYYRSSKAALNAAMRGLSAELAPRGVGLLLLHPGGVVTRMGPSSGLSPEQSVDGMFKLAQRFDRSMTGRFFRYDGTELPW